MSVRFRASAGLAIGLLPLLLGCFDVDDYCFRDQCGGGQAAAGGQAGAGQGAAGGQGAVGGQAAAGGEAGSGANGGQGGAASELDCLDGLDNDADGDADCADSDCQPEHLCVLAPPSDWGELHSVAVSDYDPAGNPALFCADGFAAQQFFAGPSLSECTPCNCTWSDASCSAPELDWAQMSCSPTWPTTLMPEGSNFACVDHNVGTPSSIRFRLGNPATLTNVGTCVAEGGEKTNPEPWSDSVQLCVAEVGAGCGEQQRCVKRPAQEFEQEVCIRQVGDVSCPPGWFDRDVTIYGSGTDTRTCEGCACDLSAVGCQGGKHTVSKGAGCLPPPGVGNELTIDSTACTQAGGFALQANGIISSKATPATPVGEQCGTVVASGEVIVGESEKVCCRSVGP